jgi:hypothetical protein
MTAAVVGGVAITLAPQLVTVPVLNAVGFSAQGVVGSAYQPLIDHHSQDLTGTDMFKRPIDSIAAGVHSSIGNVVSGSAFATLQSAGVGGAGAAVVNGAASLAGSGIAAAAAGGKYLLSKAGNARL